MKIKCPSCEAEIDLTAAIQPIIDSQEKVRASLEALVEEIKGRKTDPKQRGFFS